MKVCPGLFLIPSFSLDLEDISKEKLIELLQETSTSLEETTLLLEEANVYEK